MLFKRLSFYIALAGVIGGISLVRQLQKKPPAPPPLAEPTRSPFKNFVAASGIIESKRENVSIATPKQGLITAVHVQVGMTVSSNAPLLQLDDREARARTETLRAQTASLEAQREVEKVAIADWTDQFERTEKLVKSEVATDEERKRKWFTLEAAKARLAKIDADLKTLQAQIQQSETEREVLTVRAPREGKILQVNVRAGEYAMLNSTTTLMVLGDVSLLQIRADVDEQNAPLVVAGQNGVAFLKGSNDKKMPLRFTRIEPFVVPKKSLTGDSAERVDTRVLQIIFEMDRPPFPIYVGQQVDVFIERPADAVTDSSAPKTAAAN
jgi:HlyD family secretion protein